MPNHYRRKGDLNPEMETETLEEYRERKWASFSELPLGDYRRGSGGKEIEGVKVGEKRCRCEKRGVHYWQLASGGVAVQLEQEGRYYNCYDSSTGGESEKELWFGSCGICDARLNTIISNITGIPLSEVGPDNYLKEIGASNENNH